ncbi:MAG: hypothetical protein A2583_07010 [Bdellovibrionales bacterium RIFOXYD1_FULL_53_11]|nr:MAG: hypothetical protein A2583_07010 [Bdellovibrionales bacterium RIFOXYD1_FULL_53_11]
MAGKPAILVVDDEAHQRTALGEFLSGSGYAVSAAAGGTEALETLKSNPAISIVMTDMSMPGMDGIELIKQARAATPALDFIVMTAHGTIATAIDALKAGASDYMLKPLEYDEVLLKLDQLARTRKLEARAERLEKENERLRGGNIVVAESSSMKGLLANLEKAAKTDATVLLCGETGSGKEVLARFVHAGSQRSKGPFVAVNCSAIPENLLESEFFGHEKGSFTGADRRMTGYFEQADGGTLLLDEIGEMDLKLQAKVLRALEERKIRRVGGGTDIPVDVRFIAATNKDLKQRVSEGKFREDLFFRLNVVSVFIPPLRERKDDIGPLVKHLAEKHSKSLATQLHGVDDGYVSALRGYAFPGNVRELSNIIERSMIFMSGGRLTREALPADVGGSVAAGVAAAVASAPAALSIAPGKPLADLSADFEKQVIEGTLASNGGDVEKTAETLKVSRSALYSKISKYGIK